MSMSTKIYKFACFLIMSSSKSSIFLKEKKMKTSKPKFFTEIISI